MGTIGIKGIKRGNLEPKNASSHSEKTLGDYSVIITSSAANQRYEFLLIM